MKVFDEQKDKTAQFEDKNPLLMPEEKELYMQNAETNRTLRNWIINKSKPELKLQHSTA